MPYEKFQIVPGNTDETLKMWSRKLEFLFNKNLNLDNISSTGLITNANLVNIDDTGGYYTGSNVESALQQIGSTFLNIPSSNINSIPASTVTIDDTGGYFSGSDVESALQQIGSALLSPIVNSITFSTTPTNSTTQGNLRWNNDDATLELVTGTSNVTLQLGQEMYIKAFNNTGVTITNGSIVYISGAQGNRPTISLANAINYNNALKVIGVATHNISHGEYGFITTDGIIRDLNTNSYIEGDSLYLSTNSGQYSTAIPSDGIARITVGTVLKSHVTDGWIYVKIDKDKYMFGDVENGNYSLFEGDGTLKFNGDASVWRDELQSLLLQSYVAPAGDITVNSSEGTVEFKQACNLGDYVTMNTQINHDYKFGSALHPHLHWWQTTSNIPNWLLQYRWQYNGRPASTSWISQKWSENAFTWTAGTLNQITELGAITPSSDYGISSILQLRLLRDGDNDSSAFTSTDLVTGTVSAINLDVHIELDTIGSRQEYSK